MVNYDLNITGNVLSINISGSLQYNTEYLITLDPYISGSIPPSGDIDVLDSTYQFWFTSQYCPLFTTLGRVKLLAGPESDGLLDDTIYRMIYKNSLDVVDIYNLSFSTNVSGTYWGCDHSRVPTHMKRYVECKTAYDILAFVRITGGSSSSGGGQTKSLGDMSIKYDGGDSSTTVPKNKMQELYDCFMESMRMIRNVRPAARGIYDGTKGYNHPVTEPWHNRVVRPIISDNISVAGPWKKGYSWALWGSTRRTLI